MSSHREAPEISKDPVADSTDVYAFVSPDRPDTVTIIVNYIPLQAPAGGPNFYEFGDDVLYEIKIDNDGDGKANVIYQFRFTTVNQIPNSFLYNVGPIQSLDSPNWNRRQTYSVTRVDVDGGDHWKMADGLACPPCNIGPLSTPDYASLAAAAVYDLPNDRKVFAGQRAEGFYVDLGAVFDLGDLRPFQQLHNQFGLSVPELTTPAPGVNTTKLVNVHSIAIQVPFKDLTKGQIIPTDPADAASVIGVYTTASRQRVRTYEADPELEVNVGPYQQVSRLGNPLLNEAVIPLGLKDFWNQQPAADDAQFSKYLATPELAQLLPVLYPDVFPNLAALNASGALRADLVAVMHTGIPAGIVPGFQNSMGTVESDFLRLNLAVPPSSAPSNLGLIGGDAAGYPNGRRVFDDVFTIILRAVAGVTYPLIDPSFTPDAAAGLVDDGLTDSPTDVTAKGTVNYLGSFPYLGVPYDGYHVPAS